MTHETSLLETQNLQHVYFSDHLLSLQNGRNSQFIEQLPYSWRCNRLLMCRLCVLPSLMTLVIHSASFWMVSVQYR